jgi:hypothetical protein
VDNLLAYFGLYSCKLAIDIEWHTFDNGCYAVPFYREPIELMIAGPYLELVRIGKLPAIIAGGGLIGIIWGAFSRDSHSLKRRD